MHIQWLYCYERNSKMMEFTFFTNHEHRKSELQMLLHPAYDPHTRLSLLFILSNNLPRKGDKDTARYQTYK